ncbi:MAG: SDR family NAD(P)-dependent oxidoreductase [Candidatus Methanodesulfokora sp.]
MESLRILVTGGAGFLGSHLVRALIKAGHSVRVLDNLSTGSLENIRDLPLEFIRGDIRDYDTVEAAVKNVDVIFHLAALIDVTESIEKPLDYLEVNVKGTLNVARASRGVSAVIFSSSCAVYGEPEFIPISEDHKLSPKSPYAASKASGEAYIISYSNLNGYRPVILRLFNVYGPKQTKSYAGVISEFIRRALREEPPMIYGDGEQTRDFIHVEDVVDAMIRAMREERARGIYNIGSGKATKIKDLAYLILKLAGKTEIKPVYMPPRPGDIRSSEADITRARRDLGFEPRVELDRGIEMLIDEMRGEKQ